MAGNHGNILVYNHGNILVYIENNKLNFVFQSDCIVINIMSIDVIVFLSN